MANNIDDERMKSLKASFCRQHFPDLLQFLRDFDISQTDGKVANNTLNMNFLLQAFDHRDEKKLTKGKLESDDAFEKRVKEEKTKFLKTTSDLKATCKWHLDDVDEVKLLLAVDEYFEIVKNREDVKEASNTLFKNINTRTKAKELFPITKNQEEKYIYTFEDNTTLSILEDFGIKVKDKTLGKQKDDFARFVFDSSNRKFHKEDDPDVSVNPTDPIYPQFLYTVIPEAHFIKAFRLLAQVRNWSEHNHNFLQRKDYAFLLYKFIIFTHIGLVYICRRLWDNKSSKTNLEKNKYTTPAPFESKDSVSLKVEIEGNKKGDEISDCKWTIDKEELITDSPQKKISFEKSIKRYQQFKIEYKYNGEPQPPVVGLLNYYPWKPTLNILVKPPHEVSYTLEDIAGEDEETEEYIGNIFTKCIETYFDTKASNSDKDKCNEALKKLGEIEPNLKDLQDLLGKVDEDAEQRKKVIHDSIIPQLKNIDDSLSEIKSGISRFFHFERNQWRALWSLITVTGITFIIYCICKNIYFLLQYPIVFSLIASVLILLFSLAFIYIVKPKNLFNYKFVNNSKKKLFRTIKTIFVFLVLVGLLYLIIISCRDNHLKNYEFAKNNTERNQKVARLMESVIKSEPNDDESLKIQLAKYYLDYEGEVDKAYDMIKALINNPNKHQKSIEAIAEIFYDRGNYVEVHNIIEKNKNTQSPVLNRLKGLMSIFHFGQLQDLDKGISLLISAANKNDAAALYWLGYIYSNVIGKWNYSYKDGVKSFNYSSNNCDFVLSIIFYKAAVKLNYPKAAIELGNLFFDLNINDQAKYYYEKALAITDKSLYNEACYRMGLLYERLNADKNPYLEEVDNRYEPAIIHTALKNDTTAFIYFDELEKRGGYTGHLYIPPIVQYLIKFHNTKKALDYLKKYRPEANFTEEFVEALDAMFSQDSIAINKGKETIKKMSGTCKYAQMLSTFWDLKSIINDTKNINSSLSYIKTRIEELNHIGEEIHFAYVLAAWILKDMGPEFIEESNMYAQKAIHKNHPAGSFILSYIPKSYSNYIKKKIEKLYYQYIPYNELLYASWNDSDVEELLKIRSIMELSLRMAPNHQAFSFFPSNIGQRTDKLIYLFNAYNTHRSKEKVIEAIQCPKEVLEFWSDVAIGNHDVLNECWMLYQYDLASSDDANYGFEYREKLLTSLLESIPNKTAPIDSSDYNYIAKQIGKMPINFIDNISKKYQNSIVDSIIISRVNNYGKSSVSAFDPVNFNYSDWFYLWRGDVGILEELSFFTDKRYLIGTSTWAINNYKY